MKTEIALRIVYIANILVAGQIGISALFSPNRAVETVFQGAVSPSEGLRVVGALWLAIAILSILGLFSPKVFSPVLLLQLFYKGSWLFVAALPLIRSGADYPKGMTFFFIAWVVVLPFVIPWRYLLNI